MKLVNVVRLRIETAFASWEGNVGSLVLPGDTAVRVSGNTGGAAARVSAQSSSKVAA